MLKATLLFAFAAIYVNALVAKEQSLWYYVLSGEWDAGVNLHSITACISYICLLLLESPHRSKHPYPHFLM